MIYPSLSEAAALKAEYRMIPISRTMYADSKTPFEVLKILKRASGFCYILESLEDPARWGRYTFLGFDPKLIISCINGTVRISGETDVTLNASEPDLIIGKIMDANKSPRLKKLPPFTGGLVGYFSYDYIQYAEPSLKLCAEDEGLCKDFELMLFDKVIVFDNLKQKITLIVNARTDAMEENYYKALDELGYIAQLIKTGEACENDPLRLKSDFLPLFNKDEYCAMVQKAKRNIYEGDIFQVVLSNRLEAEAEGSLLDAYRVLRTENPSPYMFYLCIGDMEIAGASPETLVRLQDGVLYTLPLAGTKPRGKTDEEDAALENELLSDPKELAEHNMLVDLGRNDLGRISRFGSVTVEKYLNVERFSHVMHLSSTVRGVIREDKSALDAVKAVLPAGTLSGAPKIRACQIIDELENNKRGVYGGAIGYIDFTGNLDTCIAIRLAFKKNGKVYVRSGAGIVADSVPETEHQECLNKSGAVLNALKLSDGGLDG